jgi:phosphoglycerate dehydrogenase-like enzyme
MKIVFHGANAAFYVDGIEALLTSPHDIRVVPDILDTKAHQETYAGAEVMVSSRYGAGLPALASLRLFQVPGAGIDDVDMARLAPGVSVCNCSGHEVAIGEYVLAAMLRHTVPMNHADAQLRLGEWAYWSARAGSLHGELAGRTIGILGYGHIGKHIADLAKALGMRIIVANRGAVPPVSPIFASYTLDHVAEFCGEADFIVCALPDVPATTGLLGEEAFAAMRPHAVVINVGRGPVIDEDALFAALSEKRIGGAVIDTWYVYPPAGESSGVLPAHRPFHLLDNVTMTPHMSGWTDGMVARRRQTIATNIECIAAGQPLINCVRNPQP